MVGRIQSQRFTTTNVRPSNGVRPSGELWLNQPDMRLGMIDPTKAPVDLVPVRFYAPTASYAAGDLVFNSTGVQLLQARNAIAPKPFATNDWNQFQTTAQTDARYLLLSGGTLTGSLTVNAAFIQINAPTGQGGAAFSLSRQSGQVAQIAGFTGFLPRWAIYPGDAAPESTGNVGSNFEIVRFSDAGNSIDAPLSIVRATGVVNFTQPPTFAGGAMPYVPLAGGNMTGNLGVGGAGISYPSLGTYWAAHHVAIGWDGTQPEFAADGIGIGALALQAWTVANFLSINGGTLAGNLRVNGRITWGNLGVNAHAMEFGWNGAIIAYVDGTYVGALVNTDTLGNYLPLTGGVTSGTVRVNNGRLLSSSSTSNDPSITCWDIAGNFAAGFWVGGSQLVFGALDGNGTPTAAWGILTGASFNVAGNLQVGGLAASPAIQLTSGGGAFSLFFTNWVLQYTQGDGVLGWYRYDALQLFSCDFNGNIRAHADVNAGGNMNAQGNVHATSALQAIDGSMWFGSGGSGRIMAIANQWYWDWNGGNGDLYWVGPSGRNFEMRVSDGYAGNDRGSVYGYGPYVPLSDERVKTGIQPSTHGLSEVLQLEPIAFERTNVVMVRREHGFSAQQVQAVIPEAVVAISQDDEPLLGVTLDPIVAALVNATKELASRIAILEANP